MFWLDWNGKGKGKGVINANGKLTMETYETHPWYCEGRNGLSTETCYINGGKIYWPQASDKNKYIEITVSNNPAGLAPKPPAINPLLLNSTNYVLVYGKCINASNRYLIEGWTLQKCL